jgi:hypothetical protein
MTIRESQERELIAAAKLYRKMVQVIAAEIDRWSQGEGRA